MFAINNCLERWLPALSIAGAGLLLALPLLINGCLNADDFDYHFVFSRYFSEQFWQGDLYPRWIQQMNAGFGSPTFFFYAPVPYYFTSLFLPISHYSTSACNGLGLSSAFALIASGLTCYLWLQTLVPRRFAVIASIFYMSLPYHLAIDLYTRFAFAEHWSFVWMPLTLYFSIRAARGSWFSVLGLAGSLALLIMTHLPTFVIFFWVPVGYAFVVGDVGHWRRISVRLTMGRLMAGGAIAFGLSAVYWFPAMMTQQSVSMEAMSTEAYYYANNFLFMDVKTGSQKEFWYLLELLTMLTAGLAFCAWKVATASKAASLEKNYWLLVTIFSLVMMLPISEWAWTVLPVVQKIQFPWRFNTLLTLSTTALFALAVSQPGVGRAFMTEIAVNKIALLLKSVIFASIVLLLTKIQFLPFQTDIVFRGSQNTTALLSLTAVLLLAVSYVRKPIDFSTHRALSIGLLLLPTVLMTSFVKGDSIFLTRIIPANFPKLEIGQSPDEHRPQSVPSEIFKAETLAQLSAKTPEIQADNSQASWRIKQWRPREIVVQVDALVDTELTLHQFYYPNWTANIKGSSKRLRVKPSELGLLQVRLPAGQYETSLTLSALGAERTGQAVSALTIVLISCLCMKQTRSHKG